MHTARPLRNHVYGVMTVALLFIALYALIAPAPTEPRPSPLLEPYLRSETVDLSDPLQVAHLADLVALVHGDSIAHLLVNDADAYRNAGLLSTIKNRYRINLWTFAHISDTLWMFGFFLVSYLFVLGIIHYGVETLAVYRFARAEGSDGTVPGFLKLLNGIRGRNKEMVRSGSAAALAFFLRVAGVVVVFSPAYVTAYVLKGVLNTSSYGFYLMLGALSNGVLVIYAEKYYELLLAESKKGYVETARVKGLSQSFEEKRPLLWKNLWSTGKRFEGHVLQHILPNVRYQYSATFKEQASFLVTGLILVELALNIQGHLGYELLQQVTYRNFDYVFVLLFGLFLILKFVHVASDLTLKRKQMVYDNLGR